MPAISYKQEYLYQKLPLFFHYFKLHFQDKLWEVLWCEAYLIHVYGFFLLASFSLTRYCKNQ